MEENIIENQELVQNPSAQEQHSQDLPSQDQQAKEAKVSKSQEVNIRELRLAKERAERDREILKKRLEEIESKAEPEPELYSDDDFVEGKHLKKEIDSVKNQLKNYESQMVLQADEAKLKNRYSDFDKVVNSEAIEKLREADPEFAETIAMSSGSLYSRGSSVYKKIKDLGIYIEDEHQQDRDLAQKNHAKPKSINSINPQRGDSPLTMANAFSNGLTPDLKRQLWKEMQEAAKRH